MSNSKAPLDTIRHDQRQNSDNQHHKERVLGYIRKIGPNLDPGAWPFVWLAQGVKLYDEYEAKI
jgi:hypothetical protein